MLILQQINCIASKMVRKKAFEPEDFLRAVKRLNTLSDVSLARFLGCDRSSVFRFKANKKNKKYVDEAKTYIEELADENITPSRMTWDMVIKVSFSTPLAALHKTTPGERHPAIGLTTERTTWEGTTIITTDWF